MTAFIPQYDPNPLNRTSSLENARSLYQYRYDSNCSPLALIKDVPFENLWSFDYLKMLARSLFVILENLHANDEHHSLLTDVRSRLVNLEMALSIPAAEYISGLEDISRAFLKIVSSRDSSLRPKSIEEYQAIFRKIQLPSVSKRLGEDSLFAEMRLAGPNAVLLKSVSRLDDRFPLSESQFQSVIPNDSLAAAGLEGRLFLADYQLLEPLTGAHIDGLGMQKYLYAPLALFVVDKTTNALRPVAIQCQQTPGADNPIFTPNDGFNWQIAKTIVETSDGVYHESLTHFGLTHALTEAIGVSVYRQFAPNHPLYLLLVPHFEGTFAINAAADAGLLNKGGVIDLLMPPPVGDVLGVAARKFQATHFREMMLPRSLQDRGVGANSSIKNYSYRDDATLYWDAIAEWVLKYLAVYYPTDEQVGSDPELLAWLQEVSSPNGGRVRGFERAGSNTIAGLAETITMVIFTASVQHAAVNFPQIDLMSYVPIMPLANYAPAPKSKTGAVYEDFINILPALPRTEAQMSMGYLLGGLHYTTLGNYDQDHFKDPQIAPILSDFRRRLDEIGEIIDQRNTVRTPYPYLIRSGIPQSVNI